ncbi:MAG TPA: hypothetical protein VFY29_05260 [Terriglobia bacterium]|nr:hypothetical protein [Terriglobia bacterium]
MNCAQCHTFGLGRQELKCSTCHREIADETRNQRGYHSRVVDVTKGDATCSTCHQEHAGRNFDLIRWPSPGKTSFDHTQTGFKLAGKHTVLQCSQCHREENIISERRKGILVKDLDKTFLGLGTDCLSCHGDTHKGKFGMDCASCHSQLGWKPVAQFDHKLTRFPLTGMHSTVTCEKCHTPTKGGGTQYSGLAFSNCSGCHNDPHNDALTQNCAQCHATSGWKVSRTTLASRFDHSKTRYPLTGRHAATDCSSCHKTTNFKAKIEFARCADCHNDKHNGQFASRPDKGECRSCHTTDGFVRSSFDLKAHESTKYPLTGKHSGVTCQQCHGKTGSVTNYHPAFGSCADCHKDQHQGQFLARPDKGDCRSCHTVDGFTRSTFDVKAHDFTKYPLAGKHSAGACQGCHDKKNGSTNYHPAFGSCTDCHQDQHQGQFAARADKGDCLSCHTLDGFTPSTFSRTAHESTRYPLAGKHSAVDCQGCHERKNGAANYHPAFGSCADCHQDQHQGQFAGRYEGKCESCHRVEGFTPSSFTLIRHRATRFDLVGAHGAVSCLDCHKPTDDHKTTRYIFEDRSCIACHRDAHDAPRESCESCHTLSAWRPLRPFDHSKTSFPLLGAHRVADCLSCHKPKLSTQSVMATPSGNGRQILFRDTPAKCAGCHEDIHGGQFRDRPGIEDCASCHTTAQWKPSQFDHSRSAFSLTGAHEEVPCVLCHVVGQAAVPKTLVYRDAPTECAKCH